MTEQDQANINRISELLAELKPLLYGVSHLIDQDCYNPYAPIAPVDPNTIAQTEPIKEERWLPAYGCKYWYIGINDGQFFISNFHWGNDDVDFINQDTGNCFPTEEAAQIAADKIKQLLTTL